jgi:protein CASC3
MSEELNHEQIDVKLNEMSIKEEEEKEKSTTIEEQKVENIDNKEEEETNADATPEQNEEEEDNKKNLPAFIPRKGKFYEHDDRLGEEQEDANGSAIETIEK